MFAKLLFCASLFVIIVVSVISFSLETGAFNSLGSSSKKLSSSLHKESSCQISDPVLDASVKGDIGRLSQLLKQSSFLISRDCDGNTAMHLAIINGRKQVIQYLRQQKELLTATNHRGLSPLELAQTEHRDDILSLLQ